MSSRYTSDGKRRSSQTHAQRAYYCSCGKTVHGNGGKSSHARACDGYWRDSYQVYIERRDAFDAEHALTKPVQPDRQADR